MTPEEQDREAQRIKKEYAYMDKMPLEGWMWEFIRRTPEYKKLFEDLKHNKIKTTLLGLSEKLSEIGVSMNCSCYDEQFYLPIKIKDTEVSMGLPKYNVKFAAFKNPLIIFTSEDAVRHVNLFETLFHDNLPKGGDTILISISKTGKKEEIMKELEKIVQKYVTTPKERKRDEKWKYYLIVYDLIKDSNMQELNLFHILQKAFPEKKEFSVWPKAKANINNYYDNARILIELGDYKKHLKKIADKK